MGIHPERVLKLWLPTRWIRRGRRKRDRRYGESVLGHRGRRLRHVGESTFVNLGGPVPVHKKWTTVGRKPQRESTGNSDHAIVAMRRVMTAEQRAWRKEEVANEENGTEL